MDPIKWSRLERIGLPKLPRANYGRRVPVKSSAMLQPAQMIDASATIPPGLRRRIVTHSGYAGKHDRPKLRGVYIDVQRSDHESQN